MNLKAGGFESAFPLGQPFLSFPRANFNVFEFCYIFILFYYVFILFLTRFLSFSEGTINTHVIDLEQTDFVECENPSFGVDSLKYSYQSI